ncbi:amino acid ABC transporter permease [Clostridium saccharobutylicum]|uniref:Glutamine transport system permease protein GlnP n=1 Tax=Clostridium saccharobutylicum DSM 13864 TaxID=1345695 RepID=U5MU34_CLOSA|nr:amino acid ABC transporter permease [Clostridium saccharobutylicum]AGX43176.1 glutamine transport system permease protein GlnP [Clostridium saccharobutylicum DSM 13864]AQR90475.1 glutamine transport system permease protein GlnP [Clostridium saccharobutylicum]AQS00381.1 glutamine transport system permease protein GlnP [Clostridium saccharobutylicum]AQS14364.1 glutamine transport system permease protein GlnP [Clostridium saccharobutylicum]MBA2906649.1 polar amino acid transport system permeas
MNIDWNFVVTNLPLYEKAAWITLKLGFAGIIISLVIGLLCGIILYFKVKVIDSIVQAYIELSRNTPLLVQIFFLYFGLPKLGLKMNESTCAIIGLAFLGGSYMAEAFRSGLEAVGKTQIESGISLGLSKIQLVRYVIIPQAFSISMPALSANCIFLLKETSILGAISILDVTNLTKDLIGMYYRTFESLAMLVVVYLIMILPLSFVLSWLERKVRYAEFGN